MEEVWDHKLSVDAPGNQIQEFVLRSKNGDAASYSALFRTRLTSIFRIAMAILQNREDAEDAVQDTFINGFKGIRTIKKGDSFDAWLRRIAVNKSRDLLRQRHRRRQAISTDLQQWLCNDSPAQPASLENIQQQVELLEAVQHLPEMHRLVILLCYGEGVTSGEASSILDRPEGTIRRILSEAYRRLRDDLGQGLDQ